MMESWGRGSSRPVLQMSTPSMRIRPAVGSTRRNSATAREDFPAGDGAGPRLPAALGAEPGSAHTRRARATRSRARPSRCQDERRRRAPHASGSPTAETEGREWSPGLSRLRFAHDATVIFLILCQDFKKPKPYV